MINKTKAQQRRSYNFTEIVQIIVEASLSMEFTTKNDTEQLENVEEKNWQNDVGLQGSQQRKKLV